MEKESPEDLNTQEITVDPFDTDESGSDKEESVEAADLYEKKGNDQDTSEESEEESEEESTEEETVEEKQEETKDESPAEDKIDSDLDNWAVKAGYDKPENDRERKLLQTIRNGQRDFTKKQQAKKASEDLGSTLKDLKGDEEQGEDDGSVESAVKQLQKERDEERTLRLQSEFYQARSIDETTGNMMNEIIKEKFAKATTAAAKEKVLDHWQDPSNLEDLYDLAMARIANSTDKDIVAEEAARKERKRIEKQSHAQSGDISAKETRQKPKGDFLTDLWA